MNGRSAHDFEVLEVAAWHRRAILFVSGTILQLSLRQSSVQLFCAKELI